MSQGDRISSIRQFAEQICDFIRPKVCGEEDQIIASSALVSVFCWSMGGLDKTPEEAQEVITQGYKDYLEIKHEDESESGQSQYGDDDESL